MQIGIRDIYIFNITKEEFRTIKQALKKQSKETSFGRECIRLLESIEIQVEKTIEKRIDDMKYKLSKEGE